MMRMWYPNLQNADLNVNDQNRQLDLGDWEDATVRSEVQAAGTAPRKPELAKNSVYLKHYYKCNAARVPWQETRLQWEHYYNVTNVFLSYFQTFSQF